MELESSRSRCGLTKRTRSSKQTSARDGSTCAHRCPLLHMVIVFELVKIYPKSGVQILIPQGSITLPTVSDSFHFCHLREGAYVRVIGNLRSFKDTPNIVAFDIQVVEDFNQLTYHMLRAMYTHSLAVKKAQVCTMTPHGSHSCPA